MTDFSLSAHGIGMLIFTIGAFYLFMRPQIPMVITSLTIIATLAFLFYLFPYEVDGRRLGPTDFFSGFSSEALITIASLMILGHGLVATGALEPIARFLARLWNLSSVLALLVLLATCMALSAFINDTPVTILMMPVLIGVALKTHTSPSKTLMPMNFAVLIGGMATTIGTSTNLLVVSIATDLGVPRFDMFDFTHIVAVAGSVGLGYLWLVAPRLLPERRPRLAGDSPRVFDAVLYIKEKSFADGRTVAEVLRKSRGMTISKIQRGDETFLVKLPTLKLRAGDRLYVRNTSANLKEYERILGALLYNAGDLEHPVTGENPLVGDDQQLAEVVVTVDSRLVGRTVKDVRFAERHGLAILAIYRPGMPERQLSSELANVQLEPGDVLLVQGPAERLAACKADTGLLVLDGTLELPSTQRAPIAVAIMASVIASAATGLLPISVASLFGVTLMILTRCIKLDRFGSGLNAEVIVLVAASLAIGKGITETGVAQFLANLFLLLTREAPPEIIVAALMAFMALLTNFVTNNAAAAVGTPVAVMVANQLGLPPQPFVLAILFGCNLCYATPMGYQTNLLVMSAGEYTFEDFLRVGVPLVIIMVIAFAILLPMSYSL